MTKKLVIFNGPAGIGKDTAINFSRRLLKDEWGQRIAVKKMSDHFKEGMHHTFGLQYAHTYYDDKDNRHLKDEVHPKLFGRTLRQGYIDFSDAIRAKFGDDIFGHNYVNYLHNTNYTDIFIADGGYATEWVPVLNYIGADNVLVLELHGNKESENDTRTYIGDELKSLYPNLTLRKINNTISDDPDDKELFKILIEGALASFLEKA